MTNLTKIGKNRVEKRNRHGKKIHLLREKRVDRWKGRVPVYREKNSMQIIQYANYTVY